LLVPDQQKFMPNRFFFYVLLFLGSTVLVAQEENQPFAAWGVFYGLGREIKNSNYTYTNNYYKLQLLYRLKASENMQLDLLVQPEINFATHRLLNPYFIKPHEPNFAQQIATYTKLKDIREYVLSLGMLIRKPVTESFSVYLLGSVGPMINNTETERLSKGFAFANVVGPGFSFQQGNAIFDLRCNLRHVSNARLQPINSGYNTLNVEFGISYVITRK
jgi:hypothetical protein